MKTTEHPKDEKLSAIIKELKAAYKLREINEFGHDTIPWTPSLDAALATPTEEENKPYLPLPAPDLVVLGRGGDFHVPYGGFNGYQCVNQSVWVNGDWNGDESITLYAAHRDSEVARLNWEAILNRELEELGKPTSYEIPEGFHRLTLRPKGWISGPDSTFAVVVFGKWKFVHGDSVNWPCEDFYLEAVKDEPKERQKLSEAKRIFSEGVNALTDEQVDKICEAVADPVPTERQKMAKDFAVAFIHAKVKGSEFPTTQSVMNECFMLADLILGRKDGE